MMVILAFIFCLWMLGCGCDARYACFFLIYCHYEDVMDAGRGALMHYKSAFIIYAPLHLYMRLRVRFVDA